MNEINSGLRSILKDGWVYRVSQYFLGEQRSKNFILDNYITGPFDGVKVLDMGCGAGNFAYFFPREINYVGFDPNLNYIESASKKFDGHSNRQFIHGTAISDTVNAQILNNTMDYAVVHGVFHHLSDDDISQMYMLAQRVLKPGGKLIILEPVWHSRQSPINKFVMSLDRGKNIKNQADWLAMTQQHCDSWGKLEFVIHNHLIRFYDLIIMCVTKFT